MRRALALLLLLPLLAVGVVVPVAAASAAPALPKVSGSFGKSPTITFPKTAPPSSLISKTLHQGTGATVAKGNLLVVNYLGQLWRGKVFDSSFSRGQLAPFDIGVKGLIAGWNKTLPGSRVGSRLLLVIPPADGYGTKGNSSAGIPGNSTLVFVVDIVGTYKPTAGGDPHAKRETPNTGGVHVSGPLGGRPKVSVVGSATKPTAQKTIVLDKGTGRKVVAGLVVLQIVAADYSGKVLQSSWTQGGPTAEFVGVPTQPSALDALVGAPVGSRVLLEIPKNSSGGPYAVVVDIVAEP
ncbi:MAG TPA: FKBP-type peptidyl-prolyl cis-trans isomerase [Acidimicrobiales bacterium]|nr:FKBP-type peptidyl-prolyl cis-trans isomerase [Acidimicrobiales bacterium]